MSVQKVQYQRCTSFVNPAFSGAGSHLVGIRQYSNETPWFPKVRALLRLRSARRLILNFLAQPLNSMDRL